MPRAFAEIAFTPDVRSQQLHNGSGDGYAKFLIPGTTSGLELGPDETTFIAQRDGMYQASVSQTGWPYVQFRGGPAGFLKPLDARTIAYADFRGNRQYISVGNLDGDDRISLIAVDYPNRRRLKIWGRVKLVDADADPVLINQLRMPGYSGRIERAVVITVEAFDWNCPSHIPQRMTIKEMEPELQRLHDQIDALQAENNALRGGK